MTPTATLEAVEGWPIEDRLDLLFRLWDGIADAGWRPTPGPELLAELDRRLAAHAVDPSRTLTWEQVVAYVKRER